MAQIIVNPGAVAAANTVDTSGVRQSLQFYDQLALSKQATARAEQQRKQADDLQKAHLLQKSFDGLDIGTGTPYDEVGQARVQEAKDRVMAYMTANPGATYTDIWAQANEATRGISSGITEAKKAQAQIDSMVERANKEYPHVDPALLKAYYQNKAFRDKDGKPLQQPNFGFYGDELLSPQGRARFANPMATAQGVQKELAEGFKPVEYAVTDPNFPDAIIRGEKREYQDPTGRVLTEPVHWLTPGGAPAALTSASLYGGKPQIATGDQHNQYAGIPANLLGQLKARPIFADALELEKDRIKREQGDVLKGASEDQIEQIAALNLVENYGSKAGLKMGKPDYTQADHDMKVATTQFNRAVAARRLQLSEASVGLQAQGLELRKQRMAQATKMASYLQTVPGQLALARQDPNQAPDEDTRTQILHARALEQNNRETITIGGVKRPATNISKWHGVQIVEPGTKNPVSLKLVDLGGEVGEVLYEVPMYYDKERQDWVENWSTGRPKVYGSNIKQEGGLIQSYRMAPAARLQQYDRQFEKGTKGDFNNQWQSALPAPVVMEPDETDQY